MDDDGEFHYKTLYGEILRKNNMKMLQRIARTWKTCHNNIEQHAALILACEIGSSESLALLLGHCTFSVPNGILDIAALKLDATKVRIILDDGRCFPQQSLILSIIGLRHGTDHTIANIVKLFLSDTHCPIDDSFLTIAIQVQNHAVIDALLLDGRIDPRAVYRKYSSHIPYATRDLLMTDMRVFWEFSEITQRQIWYQHRRETTAELHDELRITLMQKP